MSAADRAYFEPRLGHDIGAVRIHADAGARAFSRGLGARALTVGTDIFCRDGMPTADDASGRELLPTNSPTWYSIVATATRRRFPAGFR
jgi:hypothetical protein